jgi:tetratricopeptide (TPR) repeat protein
MSYPHNVVWYIESRPLSGDLHKPGFAQTDPTAMGSGVVVGIGQLYKSRESFDQPKIRKYLLTCAHVVRQSTTDGALGWGPLLEEIFCWEWGRGYSRTYPNQRLSGVHQGVFRATVSPLSPCNAVKGEVPVDLRLPQNDWVLLEFEDPKFGTVPSVRQWSTGAGGALLKIIGFPGGAGHLANKGRSHFWDNGDVVEGVASESFRQTRTPEHGLLKLDGPDETRPGMSGGGIFDAEDCFAGLHRSSTDAAMKREGVSAAWIKEWLFDNRNVQPVDHPYGGGSIAAISRVPFLPDSNLRVEGPLPLIGRGMEVEKGIYLLRDSRLVTVHAPPGVGKSRVLLRIAHRAYEADPLPKYFFDVNYKSSADEVAEQIRAFFSFPKFNSAINVQEQLGTWLRAHGRILLVLDNFEQVGLYHHRKDAPKVASQTIRVWLERAEQLRILVGSRSRLELWDWKELCINLDPLPAPSLEEAKSLTPDRLRAFESVQLFVSLARVHNHDFERCTDEELRSLACIVAMTGGFPAPITVAASRLIDCDNLNHIRESMSNTFVKPEGTGEAVARSYLHTQLDQVFETLPPREQNCLLQASQFRGGFNFAAAASVFSFGPDAGVLDKRHVEHVLSNLVLAGVLKRETFTHFGKSEKRYGFYLPIEEWAEGRWEQGHYPRYSSLQEQTQHYHRCHDYYCNFFEEQNLLVTKENSVEALARTGIEQQNMIACHSRACDRGEGAKAIRSLKALLPSLQIRGPATLLSKLFEDTLKLSGEFTPSDDHAELLKDYSKCLYALGRYGEMLVHAQQAVELAYKANSTKILAQCLIWKGTVLGLTTGARGSLAEWKEVSDKLYDANDFSGYTEANRHMAWCYDWDAEPDSALQLLDETMRTLGSRSPVNRGILLNYHGIVNWHDGRCQQAASDYCTALRIFSLEKEQIRLAGVLTNLGLTFIDLERFAAARTLLTRAGKKHLAVGNDAWNAVNDTAIARLYLREGKYREAIDWCERVTPSVEATEYYENKALLTSIYALALFGAGDLNIADEKLRLSLDRMTPSSIKMRRYFDVLVTAAECAMALGDKAFARKCILEAERVATLRKIGDNYLVTHYRRRFERVVSLRATFWQTPAVL